MKDHNPIMPLDPNKFIMPVLPYGPNNQLRGFRETMILAWFLYFRSTHGVDSVVKQIVRFVKTI